MVGFGGWYGVRVGTVETASSCCSLLLVLPLSFLLFVVVVCVPFITVAADYWSGGMSGGWTATGGWDELVIAGRV